MAIPFKSHIAFIQDIYKPDAYHSKFGTQRHFTIICDGATIISWGMNFKAKTHPVAKKFKHRFAAIHSELHAISRFPYAIKELRRFDIFNVRLNRNKQVLLARPCSACQAMLAAFGAIKIYFSVNMAEIEYMNL